MLDYSQVPPPQEAGAQYLADWTLLQEGRQLKQSTKPLQPANPLQQKVELARAFQRAITDLEAQKAQLEEKIPANVRGKLGQSGEVSVRTSKVAHATFPKKPSREEWTAQKDWVARNELIKVNAAISYLERKREKELSAGVVKGLEVIDLQRELQSGKLNASERKERYDKIAKIFEGAESYQEMYDLRQTIEGWESGSSPLHKLVYSDVDVPICHRILKAINENVKKAYDENPNQVKFSYMVYSDIDDTIKGSLNDRQSNISGFYPSATEFYKQLASARPQSSQGSGDQKSAKSDSPQVKMTFLSARPKAQSDLWNAGMKKDFPKEMKFFSLFGTTSSFGAVAKYYVIKKLMDFIISLADSILPKDLKARVKAACYSLEVNAFQNFALDKRQNIDRDLLLRPEVRPVMVGDSGEGDLIFLLAKNSGLPFPVRDERIPDEYVGSEKWKGPLNTPGNPVNKPLFLGFAHAISSPTEYQARPDPKYREIYEETLRTHIFSNYVDNALYCFQKGIFDLDAANEVVNESRKWLDEHREEIDTLLENNNLNKNREYLRYLTEEEISAYPPDLQYRIKLIRSIHAYDKFVADIKAADRS